VRRAAGPAVLAALFVGLAAWSWRKWTDVHIDFGNELYIAWRLAEGEALYRDIAHRNGPLSHYWNAALFRAFGVSLGTLALANLAVLAGITALFHRIVAPAAGRLATTAACAFFLAVFGFSQYVPIANFNYVTPYHHFQTHGLALALGMVVGLAAWCRRGSRGGAALAGAALGALFLTKAELFVPAAGTAAAAGAWLRATGPQPPGGARAAAGFVGAALAVPLAAFAALALVMPPGTAARGVLGNWAHLGAASGEFFYRAGAGLVDVGASLAAVVRATLGVGAAVALSAGLDRALPLFRGRGVLAAALGTGVALVLVGLSPRAAWLDLPRALPVVTAALVGLGAWLAWRAPGLRPALCGPWLLAVLALGLLGKMLLAARFEQYGFVLAAPAAVLAVAAWTGALPAALRRRGGGGDVARALALACAFGLAFAYVERSDLRYRAKRLAVGHGADRILALPPAATPRPARVAATLERLDALMEPGDTLLVMPEGIMLNYWLRRDNPTSFNLFLPPEIAAFGEGAMLRDLDAHPPDWIVLAHRPSGEFGVGPFGRDPRNGRALVAWVARHYERVARIGPEPFTGSGFGTVVLRRREAAGTSTRR